MMRILRLLALAALCGTMFAQAPKEKPAEKHKQPTPQPPRPSATGKPTVSAEQERPTPPRFSVEAMDKTADPCVDFYQYACGNWRKNNPIPGDQSSWGRFNQLAEYNRWVLKGILEKYSANDPKRTPVQQKIGDYYQACMDEAGVEARGTKPLDAYWKTLNGIKTKPELMRQIAVWQLEDIPALLNFYPQADFRDATQYIAAVDQGGTSLPDRDYYGVGKQDTEKFKETRAKFVEHVQKMFELLGDSADKAKTEADTVLKIETGLAQAEMDRTLRRDPKNRDHKMTVAELEQSAPNFQFAAIFKSAGAPQFADLNVGNPEFFKQVNQQIEATPLDDLKTYVRWHIINRYAEFLPKKFVDEDFAFFSQYLNGQKEQKERWKRCVRFADGALGEALGQPYVKENFGPEAKARMLDLVHNLESAMGEDIKEISWMTQPTKEKAEEKLNAIGNNIGYPDKWRDYSTLTIKRGDLFGNVSRASEFESHRQLRKIGTKVDKGEWLMSPPTVNAYAMSQRTTINFPAGILQPPFFDNQMDDAVNYGAIGVVIGHEMTHLFDDQGSKFDVNGNLHNWWTDADYKEFQKRTSCIADEYEQFHPLPDVHLNGHLTLGENTADNGGSIIAMAAMRKALAQKPQGEIDGFTQEQRFFLGYAQVWCENQTDETARVRALTDPHSPGRFRVIGVVSNHPDFAKAFSCKAGQPMVRGDEACRAW